MSGYLIGDYIEVTDIEPGTALVPQLMRLLPPPAVLDASSDSFPLIDLGAGVGMFVDECTADLTVLAISADGVQTAVRRNAARRVFQALTDGTDWSLHWSADDADGVDGLVASRITSAPIVLRPGRLVLVSSRAAAS